MFSVIYSFIVKPGSQKEFEQKWTEATLMFRKHAGGLGSRLHKKSKNDYIAYAQWPDEKMWLNASEKLPETASAILIKMRETCDKIETINKLEVVIDLLVSG